MIFRSGTFVCNHDDIQAFKPVFVPPETFPYQSLHFISLDCCLNPLCGYGQAEPCETQVIVSCKNKKFFICVSQGGLEDFPEV